MDAEQLADLMGEGLSEDRFWKLRDYKLITECAHCKYCVIPYLHKWCKTCRRNDGRYGGEDKLWRGTYSLANPFLCGNGTKNYSW